jgi:Flp pilus assembly protein TadD
VKRAPFKTKQHERFGRWKIPLLALSLAVLAFLPYAQTAGYDFVDYDDTVFVTGNAAVRDGLTGDGFRWALTTFHAGNWMPLTWLSHMLDVTLFGLDPGWHHLVNALVHALSTAMLFLALFRMTGAVGKSAFVAAMFGVHPLHVESVAWIAERKDVLSGLFFMLTLLSYERYARRGGTGSYLLVFLALAFGLLSKSMLVTAPFVLLLLDVWPLGRTALALPADGTPARPAAWGQLLVEKAPLFLLAGAVSVITFVAQQKGGAMGMMEREVLPLSDRLANALVSYSAYLGKMFWPSSLAILYPHPGGALPWVKIIGAAVFLIVVLYIVIQQRRQRPYLAMGWLWYLGMLVPVIGVIQVGMQAMADRYTYLPMIGILIMVAWYAGDVVPPTVPARTTLLAAASGAITLLCLTLSFLQAAHWKNTVTLFQHSAEASPNNWMAHRMLGNALADKGLADEAMERYRESIRIQPRNPLAHNNLAVELAKLGRFDEAIGHYQEAVRIRPGYAEARNNLGNALANTGHRSEAIEQYQEAIRLRPGWKVPQENLELLLTRNDAAGPALKSKKAGQLNKQQ